MDTARLVALRLAKAGYGTPQEILAMPCDLVLDALEHAHFVSDYERTYAELNKAQR